MTKRNPDNPRWKHGMLGTKTYRAWSSMRDRCNNPRSHKWAYYGARGISHCKEWETFVGFFADMGEAPPGLTLERIDVNGDYCPRNCKWATQLEQQNNRRSHRLITHNGKTQNISTWARETGVERTRLAHRLKCGWPIDMALSL